ncbi:MAG TPA: hypothetical protein VGP17_06630 [Solirubrobacteraceae bacterium]|nr:hypothetical protein [Solirubrobacteraceae bacterium]
MARKTAAIAGTPPLIAAVKPRNPALGRGISRSTAGLEATPLLRLWLNVTQGPPRRGFGFAMADFDATTAERETVTYKQISLFYPIAHV